MKKFLFCAAAMAAMMTASMASASIVYSGSTLTEDFTGYDGTTGPGGWDADGFSDGAGFTENRGASAGGVTTGGTYAFDIGGANIALGVQPGGSDFTSGYYELEVVNSSGAAVANWDIGFQSYVFNNEDRGNSFDFSYSTDGSTYTPVAAGSFTSAAAEDITPAWVNEVTYSDTLSASVANGGSLFLRWTGEDGSGSGSRDEFALDNVTVGATAIPEPTSAALLGLGMIGLISRRRRK